MKTVLLANTVLTWEGRSPAPPKKDPSNLVVRILKIMINVLIFIPKWCVNTVVSLMIVPSQVMKTRILRLLDGVGIIKHSFAPPYYELLNQCIDRQYKSFDIQPVEMKMRTGTYIRGTLLVSKLAIPQDQPGVVTRDDIPTVICFNPNSKTMLNWGCTSNDVMDYVDKAYKQDCAVNVLMLDYPGVGESDGVAHASCMQEMAETAYEFVEKKLNVKSNNIHLHGWSLGSFMAAYLAKVHPKSEGCIFLDKGGSSIVQAASELLELTQTNLEEIPYVGKPLCLPFYLAQKALGIIAEIGGWDVFNTVDNLKTSKRKIIAYYSAKDEVFNGKAGYSYAFKDSENITLVELKSKRTGAIYYHGHPLTHSDGFLNTKEKIEDIIGYNVEHIIAKAPQHAFFRNRKVEKTASSENLAAEDPSISTALQMLGSAVRKKGLNFFSSPTVHGAAA